MGLFDSIFGKEHINKRELAKETYEFCPRCEAKLTWQKGYSNKSPYWVCKGCGEMLINPEIDSDISWICDGCGAMLNIQAGFSEELDQWKCLECGFINKIDDENIYLSEEEYQASLNNPFKGITNEDALRFLSYEEIDNISGREDVCIVKDDSDRLFVRKFLKTYDKSVYEYLLVHSISGTPRIIDICESDNCLIVIEEYIKGKTIEEILADKIFNIDDAINIIINLCKIVKELHTQSPAIIHRDIKPSNVIIKEDGEVVLLDVNAAKWMNESENQDTKLIGSMYYAAPEQFGYGFSSSSIKTDIYALGVLLNVLITGEIPKVRKASQPIWNIIEKCMQLNPGERYTDDELIEVLSNVLR